MKFTIKTTAYWNNGKQKPIKEKQLWISGVWNERF